MHVARTPAVAEVLIKAQASVNAIDAIDEVSKCYTIDTYLWLFSIYDYYEKYWIATVLAYDLKPLK